MRDEWGHDPSVREMRRVFAAMETAQSTVIAALGLSPFENRLRDWRGEARDLFERAWPAAARRGVASGDDAAGMLYSHCLLKVLSLHGINILDQALPLDATISKLVEEVSR
jgi:hypothetical protein